MSCYLLAYGGVGVLCPVDADADTQSRAEQSRAERGWRWRLFIYLLGVGVLESCYDMVIWVCYGCML